MHFAPKTALLKRYWKESKLISYRNLQTDADWRNISKLYIKAFPLQERKPLWLIRSTYKKNKADVWLIEDDGDFRGFAITMNSGDLVMLDYFAVAEDARGKGYGSSCSIFLALTYTLSISKKKR